jgi:hypothetical protein
MSKPSTVEKSPAPAGKGLGQTDGEVKKDQGVLYLGIDLGTSRTSVSASNGVRETIASFVGYPKDVVSRKLLKKDVLYGEEAIKNRLALDLYRPLEHGVIKCSDKKSAARRSSAARSPARTSSSTP